MATRDDPPTKIAELPLTAFELPKWLVEPAVRSCRLFNTALDFIFYDVPTLRAALAEKDAPMQARGEKPPSRIIDFDALSDPEGSLLLIDATTAPYVHKYQSVKSLPHQRLRSRPRAAARRSSATARAHRTRFMRCSNIARYPSACWSGTVRGRCRSTMRSNPFPPNGRRGCAW